jgi:calcium/calmodulin-dependent protein kinase I
MGCGSSADKGRVRYGIKTSRTNLTHNLTSTVAFRPHQPLNKANTVPAADSFFPQPTTKTDTPVVTTTVSGAAAANSVPKRPTEDQRQEREDRYEKTPVLKKREPYIPPAPITALLAEVHQEKLQKLQQKQAQNKPQKTSTTITQQKPLPAAGVDIGNSSDLEQPDSTEGDQSLGETDLLGPSTAKLANDQIEDWGSIEFQPQIAAPPPPTEDDGETVFSEMSYPNETPEPSSKSGMRFNELYRLKGVLGTGAFSTVREGAHRTNSSIGYAVKCINRKKLSEEDEAALLDEVSILKELKHQHIIRLFDFFEEPSTYYLVMERMRGGELFDRIVAKAYYNEKEARDTCKIVLEAVKYCHDNHVAHRDLKPENLLLLSDVEDSQVKIADFGFAKKVYAPNSLTTQCGTPGYVAPEILEGTAYDERADMWSVGVILYILLGGYPPFIESTQRDLFRKIRKGEYEFHDEYWGTVSADAKELISSLLTVSCSDRLTASEALENTWICGDDAVLSGKNLDANLEKLRNFNGKRKFRAAVSAIIAANKLNFLMGREFQMPA